MSLPFEEVWGYMWFFIFLSFFFSFLLVFSELGKPRPRKIKVFQCKFITKSLDGRRLGLFNRRGSESVTEKENKIDYDPSMKQF